MYASKFPPAAREKSPRPVRIFRPTSICQCGQEAALSLYILSTHGKLLTFISEIGEPLGKAVRKDRICGVIAASTAREMISAASRLNRPYD